MPLQNSACSRDASAGSISSSIPKELSPPRVAATMSGRSGGAAPEFMDVSYTGWRKKFSNSDPRRPPYSEICGIQAPAGAGPRSTRGRGH